MGNYFLAGLRNKRFFGSRQDKFGTGVPARLTGQKIVIGEADSYHLVVSLAEFIYAV
jgi:hypothetical protein